MKNRPRHFDRSIICTANNSIDRLSVDSTSIDPDAIDRFSEHKIFDRSTLHLPEGQDISKSLCDPNQKLGLMDRNGRRPALFVRLELILDESLVN
jgi:hypothetical protein